jgi:hypothetical protein
MRARAASLFFAAKAARTRGAALRVRSCGTRRWACWLQLAYYEAAIGQNASRQ